MNDINWSSLEFKSVLLTGGASGLGLASARSFAAAGAYVTIADIQDEATVGNALIDEFTKLGQHVNYVCCDVTDWDSQVASFQSAVNFSPNKVLDVVAMFAGVTSEPGNIMDHIIKVKLDLDAIPEKPEIQCLEINLIGVYFSAYLALHYFRFEPQARVNSLNLASLERTKLEAQDSMAQRPSTNEDAYSEGTSTSTEPKSTKSLIFINSLAGYIDLPKHTTYSMSKFGTRGMFRSIRGYARKWDVRCNLVAPWHIKTPMTEAIQAFMRKYKVPEGQGINWADIRDVVDVVGKCAVSEDLNGRAFAIMPDGIFDLKDDLETGFGGEELIGIMKTRRKAGDTIA
ncbi:hypothetical protein E4T43_07086 [Aureobasidium subglaciale]|nr:hypothetical protein E4T43_07086 [Aureobasidium subglaciale]